MTIEKKSVRTMIMSDFHMGYKGFDAPAAINCLQSHDFRILYLLGDIVDGWKLEKRWYWNQDYTDLIDYLVDLQKDGVKIFITPGNHDEKLRDPLAVVARPFIRMKYHIRIDDHFVHEANDGKRYLMIHGDQFDRRIVRGPSKPLDRLYTYLTENSIIPPRIETTKDNDGFEKRWSLGKAIARNGQSILNRFTEAAAYRIIKDNYDGIMYGHSHVSMHIRRDGKNIINCGSWTLKKKSANDFHTCVVEHHDGTTELVQWEMMRRKKSHPHTKNIEIDDITARHKETKQIIKMIYDIWSNKSEQRITLPLAI